MIKKLLQKNSQSGAIAVVLVCLLSFTACSKKQQPAAPVSPQQPKVAVTAAVNKPVQKQTSSVALRIPAAHPGNEFDFSNKKDPFKPFVVAKAETKNIPESSKKPKADALPIHSFDVNQFKLIGIITGGRENKAMVTDPGGKGYVLKVGMLIGKNNGKIVSINSSGVDIVEQFKDENGRVRKENLKLTLPRKQ